MDTDVKYNFILNAMISAARTASKIMLEPEKHHIEQKGDHDFVTECDKEVQAKIIELLTLNVPCAAEFICEEQVNEDIDGKLSGRCFVIDPIDGTHNFMNGIPFCAISIAYVEDFEVKASVVFNPFLDELYLATKGGGAYVDSHRGPSIDRRQLIPSDMPLEQGAIFFEDRWRADRRRIRKYALTARAFGSAALHMCFVACGRGCGYISVPLYIWDYAGALLIAREAGLKVTDMDGNDLKLAEKTRLLVAREWELETMLEMKDYCES
jgi:myo-inositol-1(or 4)-monophosphatase